MPLQRWKKTLVRMRIYGHDVRKIISEATGYRVAIQCKGLRDHIQVLFALVRIRSFCQTRTNTSPAYSFPFRKVIPLLVTTTSATRGLAAFVSSYIPFDTASTFSVPVMDGSDRPARLSALLAGTAAEHLPSSASFSLRRQSHEQSTVDGIDNSSNARVSKLSPAVR